MVKNLELLYFIVGFLCNIQSEKSEQCFGFRATKDLIVMCLCNLLTMSIHDEGYSRNVLNFITLTGSIPFC
jgi:hypothetical protein